MPRIFIVPDFIPNGPQRRRLLEREHVFSFAAKGEAGEAGGDGLGSDFFTTTIAAGWYENLIAPSAKYFPSPALTLFTWLASLDAGATTVVRARAYYENGNWSPELTAGTQTLADVLDTHDVPTVWQDDEGYFFIAYGAHNSAMRFASSRYVNDPTSWVAQSSVGSDLAYPHPNQIGDTCFLLCRSNLRLGRIIPITSASGVPSFGTAIDIVDFGADSRFYAGDTLVHNGKIHIAATRADDSDDERQHIYYFVINIVAGVVSSVSNFSGATTILAAALPIDTTEANTNFRLYDHVGPPDWTFGPGLRVDANDHPHIMFGSGIVEPGSDPNDLGDILHVWNDGTLTSPGTWSSPETVATSVQAAGKYALVPTIPGVEFWWTHDPDNTWSGIGGNVYKRGWTQAGGLGDTSLVRAGGTYRYNAVHAIADAIPAARVMFREGPLVSPDDFGALKGHVYGDNGVLRRGLVHTFSNAEAAAYVARLALQPSADEKYLIDHLFSAIKEIGIAKFDSLWLFCMASEADGLLDILNNIDAVNHGVAHTAGRGFKPDGVATFLDLLNPTTDATAFSRDSANMATWSLTIAQSLGSDIGWFDGTDGAILQSRTTGDGISFRINQAGSSVSTGVTNGSGLVSANRSLSNATQLYRNGVARTVNTLPNQTSTALNNHLFQLGTGTGTTWSTREIALAIIGGSRTAAEEAILYFKGLLPLMQYKGLA